MADLINANVRRHRIHLMVSGFARKPNMAARRLVRAIFEISPFRK